MGEGIVWQILSYGDRGDIPYYGLSQNILTRYISNL